MSLLTAASLWSHRLDLAGIGALSTLIAVIGWWTVRQDRNLSSLSVAFLALAGLMAAAAVVLSGGAFSGAITWLFLLPPLAGLLLGTRAASLTALVIGVFFVGLLTAHILLGNWRDPEHLDRAVILASVAQCLALALLFVLTRVTGGVLEDTRESLESARDQADHASEIKSAFLANMSHEIRTPMNGILGMAALAQESDSPEEKEEALRTIEGCAASLLAIINDVLDFSKIESDQLHLESVSFSLGTIAEETEVSLRATAMGQGIDWQVVLDESCPESWTGDPTRLRQILLNLCGNAIKFTKAGAVKLSLSCSSDARELHMLVEDTGIGIESSRIPGLFDEFTQADSSTTRQFGGTGLGLAITKRLIDAMQGRIQVASSPGRGSQFFVGIPNSHPGAGIPTPKAPLASETSKAEWDSLREHCQSVSLLLVEDNPINAKVATRLLENLGLHVRLAENGAEAVAAVEEEAFSFLLMDCQMPVMDGFEATRTIRALPGPRSRTPIVAMTANAMEGDRDACLSAGMDDYLTKPIVRQELVRVLTTLLKEPTS